MTESDHIKLEKIKKTFEKNFRITQLYKQYLERYPEVIRQDMVGELTSLGITKEEALVALLSEIFSLDFEDREDRGLILDYLTPSVRILNAEKYYNDPYYKNIKLPNLRDGCWEIRNECYAPYRGVICHDMIIRDDFREIPPLGFFTEEFHFPAILEDGNEWMTLTPVDLDTCESAISAAHGRVVTFGLGLGYFAYMAAAKEDVESVTVVELSADVIALFKKHILPQIPFADKIKIVNRDAFKYAEEVMPDEGFDLAFVDTWRDASDGAPMYIRMKALEGLSKKTRFMYWIENFLISSIRARKFSNILDKLDSGYEYEVITEILDELKQIQF